MTAKRVFGPVPSRRLGRSIGVNNIPPKFCSYSCSYCQIGYSLKMLAVPESFYDPEELAEEVLAKTAEVLAAGEMIDYLTIVPDGEPTLDVNIGRLLELLKPSRIKTAVITNSTMLHLKSVREALCLADWVSVKIDSVDETIWRKIDKPHRELNFDLHNSGITKFAEEYNGKLVTETMLVRGVNDNGSLLKANAAFIKQLSPSECYLSIPTRPPADPSVKSPDESSINRAFQIYSAASLPVEYLIGYEGNEFASTGNAEEDILSITSVHPMREDALREFLKKTESDFGLIDSLVSANKLICSEYNSERFYVRKLKG